MATATLGLAQFTNRELVVFGLAMCGGATSRIHTEDIAIKCHELFPGAFSWTRYPDLPDKDIVRVALTDARKEARGAYVEGRAGRTKGQSAKTKRDPVPDGWILTESGLQFLEYNEEDFQDLVKSGKQKDHRQAARRELSRIKEHDLYQMFREGTEEFRAPIGQLADLLRCRVDAESPVWDRRFEKLRLVAAATDDDHFAEFVTKLELSYEEQR